MPKIQILIWWFSTLADNKTSVWGQTVLPDITYANAQNDHTESEAGHGSGGIRSPQKSVRTSTWTGRINGLLLNSVTSQVNFNWTKIDEKCQNKKKIIFNQFWAWNKKSVCCQTVLPDITWKDKRILAPLVMNAFEVWRSLLGLCSMVILGEYPVVKWVVPDCGKLR